MSRRHPTTQSQSDPRSTNHSGPNDPNRRHLPRFLHRQRLRYSPIAADCDAELAVISEHFRSESEFASHRV